MDASVKELLNLEWRLFDDAPHAGQRSARPEDQELFNISRSSQLEAWSPELRKSWRQDLADAQAEGRNPINEKYIYMLKRADPEQYDALKSELPAPCPEKLWLVDWICQAQIAWQEELTRKYPRLTKNSRAIHETEDSRESVSFETFLRGELMICSVYTLRLYASLVERVQKAAGNFCEDVLENTVRQLGYASLHAAEATLHM